MVRMRRPSRPFLIELPAQVRALRSPVRQEIVDALVSGGRASIADVASMIGRRPDSLYFHVRRLLAVGLVLDCGRVKQGRHSSVLLDVPGRPMQLAYDRFRNGSAAIGVIDGVLRLSRRDFGRALKSSEARFSGPLRNAWGGRVRTSLNRTDIRKVNRILKQLLDVLREGKSGASGSEALAFTFVLTPLRRKPTDQRP